MADRRRAGKEGPSGLGYVIRRCRAEDVEAVWRIYSDGVMEQTLPTLRRAVRRPQVLALLAAGGALAYAATGSAPAAALACLGLAAGVVYPACRRFYAESASEVFRADLSDIEGSFLRAPGACFWVAESAGGGGRAGAAAAGAVVVGAAGAKPRPEDPTVCEVCQLTVLPAYRQRGAGRALLETGLAFARDRGYAECMVYTSSVHQPAISLYGKLGFQLQSAFAPPSAGPLLRFLCQVTDYRLRLKL